MVGMHILRRMRKNRQTLPRARKTGAPEITGISPYRGTMTTHYPRDFGVWGAGSPGNTDKVRRNEGRASSVQLGFIRYHIHSSLEGKTNRSG
jgi:hypothetical protein